MKSLDFRAINKLDTEVLSSDSFNTMATVFITVSQWLQSKIPVGLYSVIIAVYRNWTLLTDFREEYLRKYLSYYTIYSYWNLLINSHTNALLHIQHYSSRKWIITIFIIRVVLQKLCRIIFPCLKNIFYNTNTGEHFSYRLSYMCFINKNPLFKNHLHYKKTISSTC